MQHIRNFSIIAHIDHGKSTLGRPLHPALRRPGRARDGGAGPRLDGPRARARHHHQGADRSAQLRRRATAAIYQLNLIDTPGPRRLRLRGLALARRVRGRAAGRRRLAGRRGADGRQLLYGDRAGRDGGAGAQQDRPAFGRSRAGDRAKSRTSSASPAHDAILASAKTGEGIDDILEAVIARIPPPTGDPAAPLQALIIDSWFDNYVGVVMLVRVMEGTLKPRDKILLMATGATYNCEQVGVFTPKSVARDALVRRRGRLRHRRHQGTQGGPRRRHGHARDAPGGGAAARLQGRQAAGVRRPLPGRIQPVRGAARRAREAASSTTRRCTTSPKSSQALGFGFRCGFLGLLHMDIVQERLEREYDMDLITTAPTVVYQVLLRDGTLLEIENPSKLPDLSQRRGDPRADHHRRRS